MITTLILAAAVAAPQTPQGAALLFLQPGTTHSHPSVRITASTAHYAIVRFTGAVIESNPASGYLLAQKFSFGWQPIDLSSDGKPFAICTLHSHAVAARDLLLLRPALSAAPTSDCTPGNASNQRDYGPAADVQAVRAQGAGLAEIIPFVRVADGYAIMEWWGWGGGQDFYKRTPGGWKKFMGGGGDRKSVV